MISMSFVEFAQRRDSAPATLDDRGVVGAHGIECDAHGISRPGGQNVVDVDDRLTSVVPAARAHVVRLAWDLRTSGRSAPRWFSAL
jgi:hypothetical protein